MTGIEATTPVYFLVLAGIQHYYFAAGRKNKRNLTPNDSYTYGNEEQKRNLRLLHRSSEPTRVKVPSTRLAKKYRRGIVIGCSEFKYERTISQHNTAI